MNKKKEGTFDEKLTQCYNFRMFFQLGHFWPCGCLEAIIKYFTYSYKFK